MRYLQFKTIEQGKIHKLKVETDSGAEILKTYVQLGKNKFEPVEDSFAGRFQTKGAFTIRMEQGNEISFFPDGTVTRNNILIFSKNEPVATIEVQNRIGTLKAELNAHPVN